MNRKALAIGLLVAAWSLSCESGGGPAVGNDVASDGVVAADEGVAEDGAVVDTPVGVCGVAVCDDAGTCDAVASTDGKACGAGPCGLPLVCKGGECVPDGEVCDDGDPCTDDTCDPETGCAHTPRTGGEVTCGVGDCATINVQCIAGKLQDCTPKAPTAEVCDGRDNDCNGTTDDGIADVSCGQGACAVSVPGCADGKVPECVPNAAASTAESCNAKDDDCNGIVDDPGSPGCQPYLLDADQDGYGTTATAYQCLCAPAEPYTALLEGDCDDADAAAHLGATESCNGKDDDCDGETDEGDAEGCTLYYGDADQDGYGDEAVRACLCAPDADFPVGQAGDCDDAEVTTNPGAQESCNAKDDDCDDVTDEEDATGCVKYFVDEDKDGYGVASDTDFHCLCKGQATIGTYTAKMSGDCCDKDSRVRPGQVDYFGTISLCASWDFDCNKYAEKKWPDYGQCEMELVTCKVFKSGWSSGMPECGAVGQYLKDCSYNWGVCDKTTESRTQLCR